MARFVAERVLRLIGVLLAVTALSFLFVHAIPGDPVALRLGEHAAPVEIARLRGDLGLDRPWWIQFGRYAAALAHGDLGASVFDAQPVRETLARDFPATAELACAALALAIAIGIPAGVLAAVRRGSVLDATTMSVVLLGVSIPVFWLGWVLVYLLAVVPARHGIMLFPIAGRISLGDAVPVRTHFIVLDALLAGRPAAALDALRHLALPALTLATIPLAIIAKITRAAMLETLASDYVRTARAKGLSERAVVLRHALRNALLPILTVLGLQAGLLLGGAVLTESVFAWPGVGRLAFDAIANRDMPLVNGCLLLFAAVFVVVNTGVDLLYAGVDPRVRYR